MRRRFLVPIAWVAYWMPAGLSGQDEPPAEVRAAAVVSGVAIDRVGRTPVAGARVVIVPRPADPNVRTAATGPVAEADERGRFTVAGLRAGPHRIEVRAFGYATLVDTLALPAGGSVHVTVELVPETFALEPLLVVSRRSRRLESAGFYGRQERGLGRFLSREDVEARNPQLVSDLLRAHPGVRVVPAGPPGPQHLVLMRGACVPDVYVDGARMVRPFPFDEALTPDHVEGIELYAGAQIPIEFTAGACGAIAVWTRIPDLPREAGFSVRRTLMVLGGVAALLVWLR